MLESFGAALVVMMTSLIGVVFTIRGAKAFFERNISYLVSFSAGVFLITAGALTLEVFELADTLLMGGALIFIGYIFASLVHVMLPETHHHHDAGCHTHHRGARKLIIGDAIHNVADGIILVTAFAVSPTLGVGVLASIIIHEALQEVSEFFVLRQAGYSTIKALGINALVSSTILIGVGLGYFALASHELEVLLLALSAGFFMHVVVHDLLPKRHEHETSGVFAQHVAIVVVGLLVMGCAQVLLGEEHTHAEDEHHDEASHTDEIVIP